MCVCGLCVACVSYYVMSPPVLTHVSLFSSFSSWSMWKKINKVTLDSIGVRWTRVPLDLSTYLFVNNKASPHTMSTQLTGNTCYFQTYL